MPEDKKNATDPNAALAAVLSGLQKTMTELPGTIEKSVTTAMSRAIPRPSVGDQKKADAKPERKPVTDEALEGMDRKDLVSHIVAEIGEKFITPLREELTSARAETQTKDLRATWVTFMGDAKNKTMMEGLKDEVAMVIKEKPSLAGSPEDILVLARNRAPEKVKELEEAANKTAAEATKKDDKPSVADKAAAENAKKVANAFGGFEPSSGTPGASDDDKPEKVGLKDAVNRAYDEVLAALPTDLTGASS